MKNTILTMTKRQKNLEKIKLINQGLLSDSSYHLDQLSRKLTGSEPIRVYNNLYVLKS